MITNAADPSETAEIRRVRTKAAAEIWRHSVCRISTVTIPNGSGARKGCGAGAEDGAGLVGGALDRGDPAAGADQDVERAPAPVGAPERLQGDDDLIVLALAEHLPWRSTTPITRKGCPDAQRAPDRIEPREQLVAHVPIRSPRRGSAAWSSCSEKKRPLSIAMPARVP